MSSSENQSTARSWPDYRAVWRWHFYAGLFCLPFVIVLSISGAIYLFKPQIESWIERPYDRLMIDGPSATVADQVRAALAAFPGSAPTGYELPPRPDASARVVVQHEGQTQRVYVHPVTLQVLHSVPDRDRFMRWMFRLHGELLMGDRGSNVVELAACWTIVMVLTGLYLWWPRQSRGWAGVLYPRLNHGSKIVWRDLHAVVGVWISLLTLFLLATGLPWAKFWGGYFKNIRQLTGTAVAKQDWSTGSESGERDSRAAKTGGKTTGGSGRGQEGDAAKRDAAEKDAASDGGEHAEHGVSPSSAAAAPASSTSGGSTSGGSTSGGETSGGETSGGSGDGHSGGGGRRGRRAVMPKDFTAFDRVAATVRPLNLAHPIVIAPPSSADSNAWAASSEAANRPLRVKLIVDGTTGAIVSRENFRDRHWIDQAVGIGIAAHEGQLFGWPNQLLGLGTAMGLVLLSVSGAVMWWRRRDTGVLGAPAVRHAPSFSWGLFTIVALLAIYLPLFGASLIAVLLVEKLVLSRIPPVRRWLGLSGGQYARA